MSLQGQVTADMFRIICSQNQLISEKLKISAQFEKELRFIGVMSKSNVKLPEDALVRQGDRGTALYFISKGTCLVASTDFAGNKHTLGELSRGAIFGEIAHLLKCRRTATVTALDYVCLLCMPRIDGFSFENLYPLLTKQYLSYQDKSFKPTKAILRRSVDFLKSSKEHRISDDLIKQVSHVMELV